MRVTAGIKETLQAVNVGNADMFAGEESDEESVKKLCERLLSLE